MENCNCGAQDGAQHRPHHDDCSVHATYMDHIVTLMARHNALGYYYKDHIEDLYDEYVSECDGVPGSECPFCSSDLIGFHDRAGIAWYRKDGDNFPVRVDRGSPEQEFNRLKDARYDRLRTGVERI